jgi:3',5'-cyclic AMP phosphodiesterase CpdA
MTFIVHISDLHVGNNAFDKDVFFKNLDEVNDLAPDLILLTGDLTNDGYYSEFLKAKEYLNMFDSPVFTVPGNHDAKNVGYEVFEDLIGQRSWGQRLSKDQEITTIGLDSSEPDLNEGHIGRSQQIWMETILKNCMVDSVFSIITMHHHVIPVPKTGRERNVLSDAGDILKSIIDHEVNIVMCGHKHVPYLWRIENTLFVNAGSFASIKLRGNTLNSYNTYEISQNNIEILLNQFDGSKIVLGRFKKDSNNIF